MLTSDLAIITYESGRAIPDRLTRVRHAGYVGHAKRLLEIYRGGTGRTRRELHREAERIFADEADCDSRRIGAFCKLLDDASEYETDAAGEAAALRLRVFSAAAEYHPLVTAADHMFERTEREVKELIAAKIGRPWSEIEPALYADVMDQQRLLRFEGFGGPGTPETLLSRYNVAQLQACLYRAERMTLMARSDFAAIVRYAKLARLLMEIRRVKPEEYRIDLSGPASVLHETRRYGINMARFLPALLACRDWSLQATLRTPWGRPAVLKLSSEDGYRSHLPRPEEFDSSVEEGFAKKWAEPREGWRLQRQAGILCEGQHTFVPDFLFRHEDGREVYLEIVGFWTPEYLEAKRQTLRRFRGRRILIAVPQRTADESAAAMPGVIVYKTALLVEPVLEALRQAGQAPAQRV